MHEIMFWKLLLNIFLGLKLQDVKYYVCVQNREILNLEKLLCFQFLSQITINGHKSIFIKIQIRSQQNEKLFKSSNPTDRKFYVLKHQYRSDFHSKFHFLWSTSGFL